MVPVYGRDREGAGATQVASPKSMTVDEPFPSVGGLKGK